MICGVDTNLLVYAESFVEGKKTRRAKEIFRRFGPAIVIPALALGELYRVLVRKAKIPEQEAARRTKMWSNSYAVQGISPAAIGSAIDLASRHKLHIWDSVAIACCQDAGCGVFFSEDLQDGFAWSGIRIMNPFGGEIDEFEAKLDES